MSELKPCPFCGSKAELVGLHSARQVACSNGECPLFIVSAAMKVSQWNTRAPQGVTDDDRYCIESEFAAKCIVEGLGLDAERFDHEDWEQSLINLLRKLAGHYKSGGGLCEDCDENGCTLICDPQKGVTDEQIQSGYRAFMDDLDAAFKSTPWKHSDIFKAGARWMQSALHPDKPADSEAE